MKFLIAFFTSLFALCANAEQMRPVERPEMVTLLIGVTFCQSGQTGVHEMNTSIADIRPWRYAPGMNLAVQIGYGQTVGGRLVEKRGDQLLIEQASGDILTVCLAER